MSDWQDISTAPKDGTPVNLFIFGDPEMVDFYCGKSAKFCRKSRRREGETQTEWAWIKYGANESKWRASDWPEAMPLSADVTPTHWRPARANVDEVQP